MIGAAPEEIVTAWFGTFRRRGGRIEAEATAPVELEALVERMELRLDGLRTPEEERMLAPPAPGRVSWDRRLGLPNPGARDGREPLDRSGDRTLHRAVVLEVAERRLTAGWDPSVHVDEAVRSLGEMDDALNRIGERLVSWAGRDAPPSEEEAGAAQVARRLVQGSAPAVEGGLPPGDPALQEARASLARLYGTIVALRAETERAIEAAMPRRAPNLSALLGPLLAARILSQAGGLDRLSRMPSSTIQVLGAERAFFEHLRGRAPPPRHGSLFLHPDIQGAPKRIRGRIARALAGKAAIAARLDREGRPLRPELIEQFQRRNREVRAAGRSKRIARKGDGGPTAST